MLSSAFAPRTACGLFAGDLPGERQRVVERRLADAGGERRGARPRAPSTMRPVNVSSFATSRPTSLGQELGAGHVGDQAPAHLEHRHLHVGRDDADVGAEGDLEPAAEGDAVDGGDDRRRASPATRTPPAGPVGDARRPGGRASRSSTGRADRRRRWPSPGTTRSRDPAQNARPSPDSTTARTAGHRPSAPRPRRRGRRTSRRRARSSSPAG